MSPRLALLLGLGCLALSALHAGPAWRALNAAGPPRQADPVASRADGPATAAPVDERDEVAGLLSDGRS